jgi:hypothetical protein
MRASSGDDDHDRAGSVQAESGVVPGSAGTTGPERGNGAERPRARLNKLVRLGVMAEMLLAEVCRVPRDQAALWRLRDAQEAGRRELGDGLLHAVPRSWAG